MLIEWEILKLIERKVFPLCKVYIIQKVREGKKKREKINQTGLRLIFVVINFHLNWN